MSEENYLTLRKLLNENLLMELILFLLLFFLILTQEWSNILLMILPLISFGFSMVLEMIGVNKWRLQSKDSPIRYNPLGSEKKIASRLYYTSIIQLVLLFWLGAESLYRPQMINFYSLIFISLYVFTYTFGYYWIFIDLWKYAKISIIFNQSDIEGINVDIKSIKKEYNQVLSDLKLKNFKFISIGSLIVFLALNLINISFILMQLGGNFIGIVFVLPGTGVESSGPITIPLFIFVIIILSPLLSIIFLIFSYKDINNINNKTIHKIIAPLPEDVQTTIIKNLKFLNKKFREAMNV